MDEESKGSGQPSSIKPPMIKPPMAVPPPASSPQPMQSAPPPRAEKPASKLFLVINIILALALLVGIGILGYRWLVWWLFPLNR